MNEQHEEPNIIATVTVVFDGCQIEVTPGERGLGEIRVLDETGKPIWESDNIPDEFWRVLAGTLKARGYAA